MKQSRFTEEEVAEILALATNPTPGASTPVAGEAEGLTLSELQAIGGEVGIDPERMAAAAREVRARRMASPPERLLGMPRSVGRIVPLAGPLDAAAWAALVADLRETFGATGRVRVEGDSRLWWNGNLQVHVEPAPPREGGGWRLRLRTRKGSAPASLVSATAFGALGLLMVLLSFFGDAEVRVLLVGAALALAGFGQLGWLAWSLPLWAAERTRQMEGLAERWMGAGDEPHRPRLPEGAPPAEP